MKRYDLHARLDREVYQRLICEILRQRDGLELQHWARGKEMGVEDLWFDEAQQTFVQIKFVPGSRTFRQQISEEADEISRLQAKRFILTVNLPLLDEEKRKLRKRFSKEDHLFAEEDIIDNHVLWDILCHAEPEAGFARFPALWMPPQHEVEEIAAKARRSGRGRMTRGIREYLRALEDCATFIGTRFYEACFMQLMAEHAVIICAGAGMGKTTIARILALGFLAEKPASGFIWVETLDEVDALWRTGRRQVFVLDDFWEKEAWRGGRTYAEVERFFGVLRRIAEAEDKWIIFTTRSEALRKELIEKLQPTEAIALAKYQCVLEDYSEGEKAKFFFRYLKGSTLEIEHAEEMFYACDRVVHHQGYRPDVLMRFFAQDESMGYNPNHYVEQLIHCLNEPERQPRETLGALSEDAKAVAFVAALSPTPMPYDEVYRRYGQVHKEDIPEEERETQFAEVCEELEAELLTVDWNSVRKREELNFYSFSAADRVREYLWEKRKRYRPLLRQWGIDEAQVEKVQPAVAPPFSQEAQPESAETTGCKIGPQDDVEDYEKIKRDGYYWVFEENPEKPYTREEIARDLEILTISRNFRHQAAEAVRHDDPWYIFAALRVDGNMGRMGETSNALSINTLPEDMDVFMRMLLFPTCHGSGEEINRVIAFCAEYTAALLYKDTPLITKSFLKNTAAYQHYLAKSRKMREAVFDQILQEGDRWIRVNNDVLLLYCFCSTVIHDNEATWSFLREPGEPKTLILGKDGERHVYCPENRTTAYVNEDWKKLIYWFLCTMDELLFNGRLLIPEVNDCLDYLGEEKEEQVVNLLEAIRLQVEINGDDEVTSVHMLLPEAVDALEILQRGNISERVLRELTKEEVAAMRTKKSLCCESEQGLMVDVYRETDLAWLKACGIYPIIDAFVDALEDTAEEPQWFF